MRWLTQIGVLLLIIGLLGGFLMPLLLGLAGVGLLLTIVGAVLDRLERAEMAYQRERAAFDREQQPRP